MFVCMVRVVTFHFWKVKEVKAARFVVMLVPSYEIMKHVQIKEVLRVARPNP